MRRVAAVAGQAVRYFLYVFGAGFVLGMIRVPFLVPRLGVRTAELLEMPVMAVVIWLAARRVVRRLGADATLAGRLSVGFGALALLLCAELALAMGVQGLAFAQVLAHRDPVSGTVYLLLLGVLAVLPACLHPDGHAR